MATGGTAAGLRPAATTGKRVNHTWGLLSVAVLFVPRRFEGRLVERGLIESVKMRDDALMKVWAQYLSALCVGPSV